MVKAVYLFKGRCQVAARLKKMIIKYILYQESITTTIIIIIIIAKNNKCAKYNRDLPNTEFMINWK